MLDVTDLTVRYGPIVAVDGVHLGACDGETVGVIGPSGCGKSTLLRAIAGLVPPASGRIHLGGERIDDLRPDQRGVGMMFQDHALFPHRTVGENVAFGPRMHGLSRPEIDARVSDALRLVRFEGTEQRKVTELSGGEQQRVALARAIAPRPRLLMLDEPLGSLDRALRDQLLDDLPEVFAQIGTTVLYVTHDQHEALALCDRIAVMNRGRLEQVGAPEDVWSRPASTFVARFIGLERLEDIRVVDGVASTELGNIPIDGGDGSATLALRADALRLVTSADGAASHEVTAPATVVQRRFAGDHVRVEVAVASGRRFEVAARRCSGLDEGASVTLALDVRAVHRLP